MNPLGDELEVVDHGLHVAHGVRFGRKDDPGIVHIHLVVGLFQPIQRLMEDLQALTHLLHPAEIPVVAVAVLADGDVEVVALVIEIGLGFPEVVLNPGASQVRAAQAKIDTVRGGDLFMLCSDGLTDVLSDQDIAGILDNLDKSPQELAEMLIASANEAGGPDNITVIVVRLLPNNT